MNLIVSLRSAKGSPAFALRASARQALPGFLARRRSRLELEREVADDRNRPAGLRVGGRAVDSIDHQLLAEQADLLFALWDWDHDRLGPRRRDSLGAARTRTAAHAVDKVGRRSKFALDDRAANQRVIHRQHANRGRVSGKPALGLHLFL